jgi:hypothetical protein
VLVLAYFAIDLNPYAFRILSKLTTPEAVWRVLWSVPAAGIAAIAVVGILEGAKRKGGTRWALAILFVLGSFIDLAMRSSFLPSNDVRFSLTPLKVRERDRQVARAALAFTPEWKAVLAPEEVAVWIPTFIHRPRLVSVREVYDEQMGVHLTAEDRLTRRELRELVSGKMFSPQRIPALLDALGSYDVQSIVATEAAAVRIEPWLEARGYRLLARQGTYVLFMR